MARRLIGLDVGTNAVRVAEIEIGEVPVLRAFGQVALPVAAMREGEVLDGPAVTAAIQRLWKELGLRKGEVRVGVASPRVIVRPVDLPAMSEADLAGALRFQAQELIPIPLEDAVLDFQVLETLGPAPPSGDAGQEGEGEGTARPSGEAGEAGEGAALNRVLLAAAHRETVQRLVGAVRSAGLRVAAVDLVPLALIRAIGRRVASNGEGAEAIVCVGGGVTVVVAHEGGLPRFVRILGTGGRTLTDAIARDLELSNETAEALKRQGDLAPEDLAPRVRAALERPLADLLEEVRGSIDYYRTQPDAAPLLRVVLTGGASIQPGLADGLGRLGGLPVELAEPRETLSVGDIGFSPDDIAALDPYLPVPVGLALGGAAIGRRINLVGGEKGIGADTRRIVMIAAAAGLALIAGIGFLTVQRQNTVSVARDKLAAQKSANARVQTDIAGLADAQKNQQQLEAIQVSVESLLRTDVSWSRMLQEIARSEPNDVWLTAFQGTVTRPTAAAGGTSPAAGTAAGLSGAAATATTSTTRPGTPSTGSPAAGAAAPTATGPTGTVTFTAVGLDYTSVAAWIQRLSQIPSFNNLWVPSASRSGGVGANVQFTSTAAITPVSRSDRLDKLKKAGR